MQQLEYEMIFCNEKLPELSKEFADAIRIWLASIPTAVEAAEVDLAVVAAVLPYRVKSAAARSSKHKIQKHDIHNQNATNAPPGQLLVANLKKHIKLVHIECKLINLWRLWISCF